MTQRTEIWQELSELQSVLTPATPIQVYTVPAGYFDGLASRVLSRINAMDTGSEDELATLAPLLSGLSRKMPYAVPTGYFEQTIETTGAEEESSLLAAVSKQVPYTVPAGYFDNFSQQVVKRVKPPAKLIPITGRKWFRLAAAAVVAGFIALAAIQFWPSSTRVENEQAWSNVIQKANEKDLEDFVQFSDNTTTAVVVPDKATEEKNMLKDIPDSELKSFLDETEDDDVLLN